MPVPANDATRGRGARAAGIAVALAIMLGTAPPLTAQTQPGVVAGTVVAEGAQRPLPGVQVTVDGQAGKEATTDASGRFRIADVTGTTVTINARALGFRPSTQTVTVGTTNVRFVLSERAVELNQIVVTGTAGGEQMRTLGTSVSTVNVADVAAKTALPSVDALLNGRTPGVTVLPGTGMIGAGANIRIRGIGTFSLSSQPLVYVDGVRVNNATGSGITVQSFGSGVVSRLNDFDPSEIESIEVLKGPAAATLYGTEAARGVINIITKKGRAGGTSYGFQFQGGSNWFQDYENRMPTNYCVLLSPTECVNSNATAGDLFSFSVAKQEKDRGTPLFRTGDARNYAANVSGGTPLFRFFAAGEVGDNEGAERYNERRQTSVRTNLNITPSSKIDISTSMGYINSNTRLSCEGGCGGIMWESMYSNPANLPQFCEAGDEPCTWVRGFQSTPQEAYDPYHISQGLNRLTASATLQYTPFSWMTHRLAIGTDLSFEDNTDQLSFITNDTLAFFWGANAQGWRFNNRHQASFNTYDYSASVNFTPRGLSSKTSVGVQYYQRRNEFIQGEGDFFPAPGLRTIASAGQKVGLQDGWSGNNTLGFYLQEQIGWRDRLYLTGAARVDNNSAFGSDVKWVGYPKASLSYVASEEPSIRSILPSAFSSLRLRAAYGASGQQPAINTALRTLAPVPGPGGQGVLTPSTLGNENLKPERVEGLELGFETGMFNDRLGVDFTYYRDRSKDAILSRGVAPSSGFGSNNQFFNAGQITKHGVELGLKGQIINGRDLGWDVNFTLGTHSSKIDRLNGRDTTIEVVAANSHRVGYAPFDWFSYKVLSAEWDPTTRRAINAMCDNGRGEPMPCLNANGGVQAPKVFLGRANPTAEGSITSTFRFLRNFSVYGMFDYALGYKRLDNNLRIRCQIFYTCREYLEPETTDPRDLAQMQTSGTLRQFVINNARYVKFREVSLSYDAPQTIAAKARAKSAGFTLSARNLHTWTPYTGLDPESMFLSGSNFYLDQAELPQLTSMVLTLRLNY